MNVYLSCRTLGRMFISILSIFVILVSVFGATGNAFAQEPIPWLIAFPENDAVEGWEWPEGALVKLTINNAPGLEWSGTAQVTTWGDPRTYFRIELGNEYDLQIGDVVTLTEEFGTTTTHEVQNLAVTEVKGDVDTVGGTADVNAIVQVWPHGYDQDYFVEDTAEDGTWFADFGGLGFHTIEETGGRSQIVIDGNATAVDWNVPWPTPWRDEFDGSLAGEWYWVNENQDKWNLTENPGFLRIYTSNLGTGDENLLLRPVAQGDFAIETRLFFTPDTNYQFAGLVIWQDNANFLQFGRAYCDLEHCAGNAIYFDNVVNDGIGGENFATQVDNPFDPNEAYLRLERRGNMVRALYSHEGITWTEFGTHWIADDFQVNAVGLTSAQDLYTPDRDVPADFDYFELTEGWGFLPEGFHDGEQGDVPSWACNVGGWAADPDDRTTDLAIEVNVDGTSFPDWLYAGEYREDLDQAGVCEDGNCSFSTSLWETVSSYEPHLVVTYAQDIPSGDWVTLSNSPKEITCRTYDIYGYDPLTGQTKLITTNLRESDEYNPSWSPNGKKVAHDVVSGDLQSIYITDVKTGASAQLTGAGEGSNDAAWSPNGKWIVFDRAFDEVPGLYLVPATGGASTLVRENGVSADWAPSGKRLVFQQPSDGSIWTVPVDGGQGGETFIVGNGANPAWSPDGNWIAYENDGHIWKVQVNIQGTVFGDPIQLTSGAFTDGQPTWSTDGTMIVYHSGFNGADYDLWTIPAAGGEPAWLTGATNFGDYDPAYAKNSTNIAYASFSPHGQAARTWVAAFTYDLPAGYWTEGIHTYHFEAAGQDNTPDLSFEVGSDKYLYDGTVLLRPWSVIGRTGEECLYIDAIHPNQTTKFYVGWTAEGAYSDALTYYENLMAKVAWDDNQPVDLVQHEVFPITPPVDWFGYTCTYTAD